MSTEGRGLVTNVPPGVLQQRLLGFDVIVFLLSQPGPWNGDSPEVVGAVESLRNLQFVLTGRDGDICDDIDVATVHRALRDQFSAFFRKLTSALEVSFQRGDEDGISLDLVSLLLANFMSMVRRPELAELVTVDSLDAFVRTTTKQLVDPRLNVSNESQLDQETRQQIARALNKVIIQAAISVPTDVAMVVLMNQKLKYCLMASCGYNCTEAAKLSRITTKLMVRVIKAESIKEQPFQSERFDLELVLSTANKVLLDFRYEYDAKRTSDACIDHPCMCMARDIVSAIIENRTDGAEIIRTALDNAGIGSDESSFIGSVLCLCEETSLDVSSESASETDAASSSCRSGSRHVLQSITNDQADSETSAQEDFTTMAARDLFETFAKYHPDVDVESD